MRNRILASALVLALAACSGGGGSSVTPPAGGGGNPAPPAPTSSPGGSTPAATAHLSLTFALPSSRSSSKKHPAYVGADSTEFTAVVNSVDGGAAPAGTQITTTIPLSVGSNCVVNGAGIESCTLAIPAPVGTVNYTFSTGDGTYNFDTFTGDEVIVKDAANTLSATLSSIVYSVDLISPGTFDPQATYGEYPQTVNITAYDARGNYITGFAPYAYPITVSDPEFFTSGQTELSVNGGPSSDTATLTSPSDDLTLEYTGQAINSFNLGASGSTDGAAAITCGACTIDAGTPNDITFTGMYLDNDANGGLITDANYNQQTVFFAQASGTAPITGDEVGFTNGGFPGEFVATLDTATCGTGPSAVATINPGPATAFTVTALNTGLCKVKLSESGNGYPLTVPGHTGNAPGAPTHDGTFWISVTSASIGINHTHPH